MPPRGQGGSCFAGLLPFLYPCIFQMALCPQTSILLPRIMSFLPNLPFSPKAPYSGRNSGICLAVMGELVIVIVFPLLFVETPSPERPQQCCNDTFFANHLEFGAKLSIQAFSFRLNDNNHLTNLFYTKTNDFIALPHPPSRAPHQVYQGCGAYSTTFLVQHPENLSHPRAPIPLGAMSTGVALDARKIGGDGDPFAYIGFTSAHPPKSTKLVHGAYDYGYVLGFFMFCDFAGCKLYDVLASKGDGRELGSGTTEEPAFSTWLMGSWVDSHASVNRENKERALDALLDDAVLISGGHTACT
ncbi:hypothetical protein C8J56DRAFT_1086822 [Mycena floridula]|nr:hypothetical protein C8J56DRAFT_1086822 [Mycena floridula]